jgi:iron-sulfur cluster assembly accessory protein
MIPEVWDRIRISNKVKNLNSEVDITMAVTNQITKDTIISDVLAMNPHQAHELAEIMTAFGIHCVGCGAAGFESLEQGVLGHGYSQEQLDGLIAKLNEVVSQNGAAQQNGQAEDFSMTLTPDAVKKVKHSIEQYTQEKASLRVGVRSGGCSGFTYELAIVDEPSDSDLCFEQDGVSICVARKALDQLNGIEIDYIDTLNESGFKFRNPNASRGCGCGKSFR